MDLQTDRLISFLERKRPSTFEALVSKAARLLTRYEANALRRRKLAIAAFDVVKAQLLLETPDGEGGSQPA